MITRNWTWRWWPRPSRRWPPPEESAATDSRWLTAIRAASASSPAAYGSYLDPHVNTLRRFRDEQLRPLPFGPQLIFAYYQVSPALANYLVLHPWAKVPTRAVLTGLVAAVEYPWATGALMLGGALLYRRRRRRALQAGRRQSD